MTTTTEPLTPARAVALLRAHGTVAHRDGLYKVGSGGWLTERELLALAEKETPAPTTTPANDPLSAIEQDTLARYEATIARGVQTFVEVGEALSEIRDARLYRAGHATFDQYCRERWNIGRGRAYQLIGASEVARELSTVVDSSTLNERQARELGRVDADQRPAVIGRADELAGSGKRTTTHIKQAVQEARPTTTTPPCEECGAPAVSKRNIGGLAEWRCQRCTDKAEMQEEDDQGEIAPPAFALATMTALLAVGAAVGDAGRVYPPRWTGEDAATMDEAGAQQALARWDRLAMTASYEVPPAVWEQRATHQIAELSRMAAARQWDDAKHTLRLLCATMGIEGHK